MLKKNNKNKRLLLTDLMIYYEVTVIKSKRPIESTKQPRNNPPRESHEIYDIALKLGKEDILKNKDLR